MDEDAFLKTIKDEYNISKKNDKDKLNINNFKIRKQFDDFFGDIDVNKFFEIFNKLNISEYQYTNKHLWNKIIDLFLKYFINHKLKWSEWLTILLSHLPSSDKILISTNKNNLYDLTYPYNEYENKYDGLINFFDKKYKSDIENSLYKLEYDIKLKSQELGTISRRRKQKQENYIQWSKDYYNAEKEHNDSIEYKNKYKPIYEKYLLDFQNIKDNNEKNKYIDELKNMKLPKPKKLTKREKNIIKQFHNLNDMKVSELKQIAKDNNLKGYSTLRKKELIKYIDSVKNTEIYKSKDLTEEQKNIVDKFMNYKPKEQIKNIDKETVEWLKSVGIDAHNKNKELDAAGINEDWPVGRGIFI